MGRDEGVTDAKLDAVVRPWAELAATGLFTEPELAALAYAQAMTIGDVDEETFAAVREHFDEDAVVELTATVAFENASARFNRALRVRSQELWRRDDD